MIGGRWGTAAGPPSASATRRRSPGSGRAFLGHARPAGRSRRPTRDRSSDAAPDMLPRLQYALHRAGELVAGIDASRLGGERAHAELAAALEQCARRDRRDARGARGRGSRCGVPARARVAGRALRTCGSRGSGSRSARSRGAGAFSWSRTPPSRWSCRRRFTWHVRTRRHWPRSWSGRRSAVLWPVWVLPGSPHLAGSPAAWARTTASD